MSTPLNRFQKAMARLLKWEVGDAPNGGLTNNPKDPGGWTKWGVSLRWLSEKGIDVNGDGKIDAADVKGLEEPKAEELYRENFWRAAYDQIKDEACAIYVFDMSVNMGEARAHRIAQEAAGCFVDGQLGAQSIAALNAMAPEALLARMRYLRAKFYRDLAAKRPALAVFLKGWLRRAEA